MTLNSLELRTEPYMRLISIFTFLMSSMVMYRSNSDHNVVCRDIWFRIKRNLGPFLVNFRSLLTSSEVPRVPNFCQYISGSPVVVITSVVSFYKHVVGS